MDEFDEGRTREEYEAALSRFPYPLEIVGGAQVLDAFEHFRAATRSTALVLGSVFDFTLISEIMERNREEHPSIELVLDRAKDIAFPRTLREMRARRCRTPRRASLHKDLAEMDWPETPSETFGLSVAYRYSGEPYSRVHIALLPTSDWTEAPAYLRAGGWNDCPEAAMQVAALRYWRDLYDIELIGGSFDTMNIRVGMGPTSRDDAIRLAEEHSLFCSEIAPDALIELAADLIAHQWWRFWWD